VASNNGHAASNESGPAIKLAKASKRLAARHADLLRAVREVAQCAHEYEDANGAPVAAFYRVESYAITNMIHHLAHFEHEFERYQQASHDYVSMWQTRGTDD